MAAALDFAFGFGDAFGLGSALGCGGSGDGDLVPELVPELEELGIIRGILTSGVPGAFSEGDLVPEELDEDAGNGET